MLKSDYTHIRIPEPEVWFLSLATVPSIMSVKPAVTYREENGTDSAGKKSIPILSGIRNAVIKFAVVNLLYPHSCV